MFSTAAAELLGFRIKCCSPISQGGASGRSWRSRRAHGLSLPGRGARVSALTGPQCHAIVVDDCCWRSLALFALGRCCWPMLQPSLVRPLRASSSHIMGRSHGCACTKRCCNSDPWRVDAAHWGHWDYNNVWCSTSVAAAMILMKMTHAACEPEGLEHRPAASASPNSAKTASSNRPRRCMTLSPVRALTRAPLPGSERP